MVSPAVSPDEEVWRRDVAQTVLHRQLTTAAQRHSEVNTVTQLLKMQSLRLVACPLGWPSHRSIPYMIQSPLFSSARSGELQGDERVMGEVKTNKAIDGTCLPWIYTRKIQASPSTSEIMWTGWRT
nr:unnamed protein product [Callosobruchus analis]